LISSNKAWQSTGATNNITTSDGAIEYSELFPALRINRIFDAIQSNYNISFTGNFLNDSKFKNAFLWLKNADVFKAKSNEIQTDFVSYNFEGQYPINDLITVDETANTFEYFGLSGVNWINATFLTTANTNGLLFSGFVNGLLLFG